MSTSTATCRSQSAATTPPAISSLRRRLIDENEAAIYLGLSSRTLQSWRVRGGGPQFVPLGASVRYDLSVLDAWIDARTRTSTSDPGPAVS